MPGHLRLACLVALCLALPAVGTTSHTLLQPSGKQTKNQKKRPMNQTQDYEVFVLRVYFRGLLSFLFHTEVLFCQTTGITDQDVGLQFPTKDLLQNFHGLGEFCESTGYPNIGPEVVMTRAIQPRFGGMAYDLVASDRMRLTYVGSASFGVSEFLRNMKKCGNWKEWAYSSIDYNCNDYTDAVLQGLGFAPLPKENERWWFRRWIKEPGRWQVSEGRCRGSKCISKVPDDPCSTGICHDHSKLEWDAESRSCQGMKDDAAPTPPGSAQKAAAGPDGGRSSLAEEIRATDVGDRAGRLAANDERLEEVLATPSADDAEQMQGDAAATRAPRLWDPSRTPNSDMCPASAGAMKEVAPHGH